LLYRFNSIFGTTPAVVATLYRQLQEEKDGVQNPVHLLWALLRLKTYSTDGLCAALTSVSEKTFRKWRWEYIHRLSLLQNVSN